MNLLRVFSRLRTPPPPPRNLLKALQESAPRSTVRDEEVGEGLLEAAEADTRVLGPLAKVPAFGPAAITVLRQFDREDVPLSRICGAISSDTTMLSQLLALANSSLFGNGSHITRPEQAVLVLGVQRTRALAATIAMQALASGSPKRPLVRRIWRHSVATAVIAEVLAPYYQASPEIANVAGILHDLGRFGMLGAYREPYAAIVIRCHEDVPAILQAETDVCGMDHTRAGALLARAWHIPDVFRLVVELHHSPPAGTGVANLIHLACSLADTYYFPAIAYSRRLSTEDTVAQLAPPELAETILSRLASVEQQISARLVELDF